MRLALVAALVAVLIMPACDDKADVVATDERLEGVIVAVDSAALDDVNSFTLKDGDQTYEVYIADDIDYGFPLGHLQVHVQEALPVVVETETRDGQLYALSIEDG